MTNETLTPASAQAAMDAAVAKEHEVDKTYRLRRDEANETCVVAIKQANDALNTAIAGAKAIRDVGRASARRGTARASALVRRASQVAARAKAEAKAAEAQVTP